MVPVIIFTLGLCVAIIKCIPTALANCAKRAIGISTSLPAVIIKSANSSTTKTIKGKNWCPFSGFNLRAVNLSLYSLIFLQPASFNKSYLLSISIHNAFSVLITFLVSVIMASCSPGSFAKKCFSMTRYKLNSTFFGSTKTNFNCEGCFLYNKETKIAFKPTDLP